jgi:hypothetical protein
MSAQVHEILIYKGEEHLMASDPFAQFLLKKNIKIKLRSFSTGCLRGYLGKWEIKDNKLYFIDFQGQAFIGDLKQFPEEIERAKEFYRKIRVPNKTDKSSDQIELSPTQIVSLSIKTFFVDQEIIFADWFSGIIRLQTGKFLFPGSTGFTSIYEEDVFLKFENGNLIDSKIVKNEIKGRVLPPPPMINLE